MTRLAYRLLNVFTRDGGTFTGNPLCVFEDGSALDAAQMQQLARQFNLSETTFILPSSVATARVRIFTPDFEMPFAGHPTLGTAHVVRALAAASGGVGSAVDRGRASGVADADRVELEMIAGVIPVAAAGDTWTLSARAATHREVDYPIAQLAHALGIHVGDILAVPGGARPLWVSTGTEQLIVPLASAAAVDRVLPQLPFPESLRSAQGRHMAYVFVASAAAAITARFLFESGGAFPEDPATGSACANLGGWHLATGAAQPPFERRISQGARVLRPSLLRLSVDADRQIRVGGEVVELGRGEVTIRQG
jgi:PhzF family phenazine biosynthesis protein